MFWLGLAGADGIAVGTGLNRSVVIVEIQVLAAGVAGVEAVV